ncbi:hypothetical protein DRE_04455 [Drechslerella stenobrocha 248]|uniref:RING-type domain-containing protein n=1 Tax=Drechslerella stenobrocha 248 TaxID=1043628 RepID=W7HSQ3_9PEZI|nr:hypothetical protein DRE_04455 [Drechslerella stenobrocha 248]
MAARSVLTTVFRAVDVATDPASLVPTKRPIASRKRRPSCDSAAEQDGASGSPPEYITLWRHRLQLNIPQDDLPSVAPHLNSLLSSSGSAVVSVNFANHYVFMSRDSISFTIFLTAPPDNFHLLSGRIPLSQDSRSLYDFLEKLQRSRKVQDEFAVVWSVLPPSLDSTSPHITVEFELKRRDSWKIDWKPEKWLPAFLTVTATDSEVQLQLAQLAGLIAITEGPAKSNTNIQAWDFYNSVHVPSPDTAAPEIIQVGELTSRMFPFQMRTVNWMMEREGVTGKTGSVQPLSVTPSLQSLCINETVDWDGKQIWVSIPLALATTNRQGLEALALSCRIRGGILAEEMGLGKTVELISLISLHRREIPVGQEVVIDPYSNAEVRASKSTLIICPPSILQQWISELKLHAPGVRVFQYTGTRDLVQMVYQRKNGLTENVPANRYQDLASDIGGITNAELVDHLLQYDIVLSNYNVLATELHYAERPPERSMRHEKKYERRSCPLVEISWWRVCLDEAQMIENGISNAAQVARVIPRVNVWAVTGTPVHRGVDDLFGLLVFLRKGPWGLNRRTWSRLCDDKRRFASVFHELALRHTKDMVHEEIKLPRQHRMMISLGFSQVEEQNYKQLFEWACSDIGVNADGSPVLDDWDPGNEELRGRMRTWLSRLRQTCVHPQVGKWNQKSLGASGSLKTVDEILEAMIQQNTAGLMHEQRLMFMLIAARSQAILENLREPREAIKVLRGSLDPLTAAVEECRKEVEAEAQRRESERRGRKETLPTAGASEPESSSDGEYGDEGGRVQEAWEESEDDDDDGDGTRGSASELNKRKHRLRDIIEVLHLFHFYLGSAYFNLKDSIPVDEEERREERERYTKLEDEHYETAKHLRKELMSEQDARVNKLIGVIQARIEEDGFVAIPEIDVGLQKGGIESNSIVEDIALLAEKLEDQSTVLDEWRERLIELLQAPLIDQEENADGDELQHSAELQDECFLYVSLLRTVIADRSEALTGITSGLAAAEIKSARIRAERQGEGGDKQHKTLFEELNAIRNKIKPIVVDVDIDMGVSAMPFSMKGLINKLRQLANPARDGVTGISGSRSKVEAGLVATSLAKLQPLIAAQEKTQKALEKEIDFLGEVFNARAEFYRQLQVISDMVKQFDEEKAFKAYGVRNVAGLLTKFENQAQLSGDKVAKMKARGRFLQHLQESQGGSEQICIICREPVVRGVLSVCGHQYCKECMDPWFQHRQTCPMCGRRLQKVDLYPFVYAGNEITIEKENHANAAVTTANAENLVDIYTGIDAGTFKQIKKIHVRTSFGSKIDMVVKHLLWIRATSSAKSVIFSQWKEVLNIFKNALEANGVGFTSLEDNKGGTALERFKTDPRVEVFLLHARSQSAGLTLVAASHVFLCEPLVNTGLELQAIARVHRIGQQQETGVYLYVIGGTVEEGVYRCATKRRIEMMSGFGGGAGESMVKKRRREMDEETDRKGKRRAREGGEELEMQLETANSLQMQEEPVDRLLERSGSGGEVVDDEQLWSCLFGAVSGKMYAVGKTVHTEMIVTAREEGRGNIVDDSMVDTMQVHGQTDADEAGPALRANKWPRAD